jgi:hypothetical protein
MKQPQGRRRDYSSLPHGERERFEDICSRAGLRAEAFDVTFEQRGERIDGTPFFRTVQVFRPGRARQTYAAEGLECWLDAFEAHIRAGVFGPAPTQTPP